MEIIKLQEDSLSIHFDEIEKEILNDLTQGLLAKLGNEDPQGSIPRLFPEAILNQPDLDFEYRAMTVQQLKNSHRKALEALNLLTSEKETSLDDLILVIKGLNIIRLELGEELDIDDDSESPPADDSNYYRLWMIFQYLGQLLFQCVEELERNF